MNPLEEALGKGQSALNEYQAKQFLAGFGVPTCREALARDPAQAVAEAARIGFPVVLKAAGATLLHKTEVGGVALNLKSPAEVKEQASRLLKIPGCETLLVQEMIQGDRELVCGLTRDAQLGPCVMFGLGGIFTEVMKDVTFRVAPLEDRDAMEMMDEIRGRKRGLYVLAYFKADPEKIREIEHDCELDERVLRQLILRRDKLTQEQIDAQTPATGAPRVAPEDLQPGAGQYDDRGPRRYDDNGPRHYDDRGPRRAPEGDAPRE